jgi:decaprenyl-phosphate phosphoribosyltransferase
MTDIRRAPAPDQSAVAVPVPRRTTALIRLSRPKQWHKGAMVFAAPIAAGVIDQPTALLRVTGAAIAFTLLSIAVYALNDVRDAPDDRRHPRKQYRPVAAGVLSTRLALTWAVVTASAGLGAAALLGVPTLLVALAYLVANLLYVYGLKHVAVVDVVSVALGFVLRAAAGATATGIPVSDWFLLVSLFGALFLVAGKRRAERSSSTTDARSRPVLAAYSPAWLDQLMTVAMLGALMSYGLWAFQYLGQGVFRPALALSFLPFLIGLLRYALLVSNGRGEVPEHDLFRDRVLVAAGISFVLLVAIGLYVA